jgi:hypothetical protein
MIDPRLDMQPMPFVADVRYLRTFGQNEGEVYIGRKHPRFPNGSEWGNPFHVNTEGNRDLALVNFIKWLRQPQRADLLRRVPELAGKTLGCWCAPHTCHGHILATLANNPLVYSYYCGVSLDVVMAIRTRSDAWPLIPSLESLREYAATFATPGRKD